MGDASRYAGFPGAGRRGVCMYGPMGPFFCFLRYSLACSLLGYRIFRTDGRHVNSPQRFKGVFFVAL